MELKKEFLNKAVLGFLIISSLFFTGITIFLLPESKSNINILFQFYLGFGIFATKYLYIILGVFIASLLGVGVLVWKKYHSHHLKSLVKLLSVKISIVLAVLIIGFHLGFGIPYLVATAQAGYVVIGSNMGIIPGKIVTDANEISKKIQSSKSMPHVVYYDYSYKKSLVLVRLNAKPSFYSSNLIISVPDFVFEKLSAPQAAILLVDDKLLITELKEDVLEKLSPTLGKLLIKNTFKDKNIKSDSKISLLNRQEYLKLREKQINEQIKKLDDEIVEVDKEINITYGYISENKKQLQEADDFLANSETKKTATYNECKSAGENYEGHFYRYYTDDQCNSILAEWDKIVREVSGQTGEIRSALSNNQRVLADYQSTRAYTVQARNFVNEYKNITPDELGIFLPEKDIKIALDSNNPDVFNGYLATLVHEYLHYTTYVSDERELDHFFEEGLTEYFAKKIMKKQLNYSENIGYPVAVTN
ncbi:hypothetical protein HZA75_04515 [Candidatus Roizmanbacteria bacterium]|nr:hypothetical protein [Candidatus Roizmanbacteria bacterium]